MIRARFRSWWRTIKTYALLGGEDEGVVAGMLAALEWAQRFLERSSETRKKKHRLLRRFLPSLVFLVIGFFLFSPVSHHARAQSAVNPRSAVSTVAAPAQQSSQLSGTRRAADDPCAAGTGTAQPDPLTGLPLSQPTSGNTPCPVTISNTCSMQATSAGDWILGGTGTLLVATNNTVPTLYSDWIVALVAALAVLGIPFSIAGYQIMRGTASTHYAGALEILSRVVLIALVALVSYTLIQMVITVESNLAQGLYQALGSPAAGQQSVVVPTADWCVHAQNFFGNLFNLTVYGLQSAAGTLTGQAYAQANYTTTLSLIENLPVDALTLLTILLAGQLLIRLALLNFYIILSPLAIISGALPGEMGQGAAQAWIRGILALLFVQLLQLLVLSLGTQLFPGSLTSGSDWLNLVLSKLLPTILLIITLNIPRLFGVSSTNLLSSVASSVSGSMTGLILILRGF